MVAPRGRRPTVEQHRSNAELIRPQTTTTCPYLSTVPLAENPIMARRVIMRIELTPSAKELLTDLCHRNGMTQVSVMSRITEWFAGQSELIQAAVLRQYPK